MKPYYAGVGDEDAGLSSLRSCCKADQRGAVALGKEATRRVPARRSPGGGGAGPERIASWCVAVRLARAQEV